MGGQGNTITPSRKSSIETVDLGAGLKPGSKPLYKGAVVSFHNISYEVKVGPGLCKQKPTKIINNISGVFKPGTMNAIMGPTGSGKSSLLDILAARKNPSGLTGKVLINGHPQPSNFRLMSGYVVQDDVMLGTMSVRETLQFSADLRCSKDMTAKERVASVEKVIEELGLEHCADTRCGDEFTRGVSGGERKRCSVGMELVTKPGVLFLDEPTSGLDSATANAVMYLLRRLADQGSTVIFSIHQPRYSIFKLFDNLCLLGKGEIVYSGPPMQGLDFFASLGYEVEEHDNPADFFLDVILGNIESTIQEVQQQNTTKTVHSPDAAAVDIETVDDAYDTNAERVKQMSANLARSFKSSKWGKQTQDDVDLYENEFTASGDHLLTKKEFNQLSYNSGFFAQFAYVSRRTFKDIFRNPRTAFLQSLTMGWFAFVGGSVYYDTPKDCETGVMNRAGAFFFLIMNIVFANLTAVELFIHERKIFIHENTSGFYRVSAYFFAKLVSDVLPNRTIPVIWFCAITYWTIGLVGHWQNYLFYTLTFVMASLAGSSVAFLASATTHLYAIASLGCALFYVFQMVFSGFLVNLNDIADWLSWAKYISLFYYANNALQANEFKDVDFNQTINYGLYNVTISCVKGHDDAWLEANNIAYEEQWDLWINIVGLAVHTVVFLFLSYLQLRRIRMLK